LPLGRAARSRGRRPELRVTLDLPTPAVLGPALDGVGPPIIALPLWTLETLDAETLDLIVLHELAHVERGDDRDLLVQAAIEAVFGWHPAVWWTARRLDAERERACDDEVVARTQRALAYARGLVGVAEHARGGASLRTAPGIGRSGRRLRARVERLLSAPADEAVSGVRRLSRAGGAAAVLTAAAAWLALGAPRVHVLEANQDRMPTSSMMDLAPAPAATPPVRERAVSSPLPSAGGAAVVRERRAPAPPAATSSAPDTPAQPTPVAPVAGSLPASDASEPIPSTRHVTSEESSSAGGLLPATPVTHPIMLTAVAPASPIATPPTAGPWKRTADAGESIGKGAAQAGESIGKGATRAGVKTAGFFTRMGKAVASSF
jgi:hypothetical protein